MPSAANGRGVLKGGCLFFRRISIVGASRDRGMGGRGGGVDGSGGFPFSSFMCRRPEKSISQEGIALPMDFSGGCSLGGWRR